jgi:hypothetical protein
MIELASVGIFVLSVAIVALADLGKSKYKTKNVARLVTLSGVALQVGYFAATAGGSTIVQVCVYVK